MQTETPRLPLARRAAQYVRMSTEHQQYSTENQSDKIVVVRIPARFTEDKVKTLMGSMNAQLEGSGYRTVFVPEEVDIYFLGQNPPSKNRWA